MTFVEKLTAAICKNTYADNLQPRADDLRGPLEYLARARRHRYQVIRDHHDARQCARRHLHDRIPVILPPACWPEWLGEIDATPAQLKEMLRPYPSEGMALWPVDRRVGNVRNDSPDLFEPLR